LCLGTDCAYDVTLASVLACLHLSCIWLVQSSQERRACDDLGDDTKIITEEKRAEGCEEADEPLKGCKQKDITGTDIFTGSSTDL